MEVIPQIVDLSPICFRGCSSSVQVGERIVLMNYIICRFRYIRATQIGHQTNGKWNGIIKALQYGLLDVSHSGIFITPEIAKVVDISPTGTYLSG